MGIKSVLATAIGVVTIVPLVHSIIANRNPAYVAGTEVASANNEVLALTKDDIKDNKTAMKKLATAQKDQAKADKDADKLQGQIDKKADSSDTEESTADELEAQAIAAAKAGNQKEADKLMKQARKQRNKELKDDKNALKNQDKLEKKFPLLGQDADGNDLRTTKKAMDAQLDAISAMRVAGITSAALNNEDEVRSQDRATQQALILASNTKGLISVLGPSTPVITKPAPVEASVTTKPVASSPVAAAPAPTATPVKAEPAPTESTPTETPVKAEPASTATPVKVEPVSTATPAPAPAAKPAPAPTAPAVNEAAMAAADRQIATLGTRTLQAGESGQDVSTLQSFLGVTPTGTFDAATQAAVAQFQYDNGIDNDGVVGRETRPVIQQAMRAHALTPTAK